MQVRSSSASHVALLAALALALLAALAVAPRAEAFVYWTNSDSGSIGRANNDGSGANQFFITGCTHPLGMAIDGQHIYWSNEAKHAIGRANLDGTGVDQEFVTGVPDWIYGIAVTDDYIFWVTSDAIVGRANIDGTGVNTSLVPATEEFSWDIYARGSYVYWSFLDEDTGVNGIHRSNLQGKYETRMLYGKSSTWDAKGIWVGPTFIYWANGMYLNRSLQPLGGIAESIAGFSMRHGLASDGDYFYSTASSGIVRVAPWDSYGLPITSAVSNPWDVEADTATVASEMVGTLRREIRDAALANGVIASLTTKLRAAEAALLSGNASAARGTVDATVNFLKAQSGKQVPAARAADWIKALEQLRLQIA